jgi:lysozyme family protein
MAGNSFGKRDFLRLAGGATLASMLGQRVIAQDGKILGLDLPKQVVDLIPRKPLNYLRIADAVVQLERDADRKGLPSSPLEFRRGQSLADFADSLYQMAMPRLVALIDRSENVDNGFADRAGELLAELHQSQHELPELLRLGLGGSGLKPLLPETMRYLVQPEPARGEIVFVPGAPPPPNAPFENTSQPPVATAVTTAPTDDDKADRPLSKSRDFSILKPEYARLFRRLTVRPQYQEEVDWHMALIRKSRERYERVGIQTGVPWHFIAVTHGLEASFNFRAHFHNGDFPLSARTRQVPAGRPTQWLPPSDWESSAKDALRLLGYTGQKDWSLERTLYRLEAYNGLGYRGLGVPTPYLWSFSNNYERGKFVADGKFSSTAKSQQCGAAVLLKLLADAGEIRLEAAA